MPLDHHILVFLFTTLGSSYGVVFGGGSFMVLPILFLIGIDPRIAVATNVASAVAQLITGATIFSRHKKVHYEVLPIAGLFYLIGGILGSFVLIEINPEIIKKIVAGAIIVFALFGIFKRSSLLSGACKRGHIKSILTYPALILVGGYQIVITAGAGTLMTFILVYLFNLSLKCAIYTRQIVTLPTMLVASGILVYHGLIDWTLLIPLVLGRITGAVIGSEMVMHTARKKLAAVFTVVVILIAIRTLLG